MRSVVIVPALLLSGLIHLLPVTGVLGGAQLSTLYGVTVDDPTLLVLLRHRAVLFGLVGAAALVAIWLPRWRAPAIGAGLISAGSFLCIALVSPGTHPAISRIVTADVIVAVFLAAAAVCQSRRATAQRARS